MAAAVLVGLIAVNFLAFILMAFVPRSTVVIALLLIVWLLVSCGLYWLMTRRSSSAGS